MCCQGDIVKSITLTSNINNNGFPNFIDATLPSLPSGCDDVVIKNVSYLGSTSGLYCIWSSLLNDIVATVAVDNSGVAQVSPNTRVNLNGITPVNIRFEVRELDNTNAFLHSINPCFLSITLEFIKRRVSLSV